MAVHPHVCAHHRTLITCCTSGSTIGALASAAASSSVLTPRLLTPSSGDRIPAIVSAVSTVVALVGVAFTFLFQLQDAVSEAVTSIPTVGVDFGGIGGGVWGVDAGLFQVFDVAQFVVMSGQLSGTATPWVVKYFIEYFTPFTGLVPVKGEASFPYDVDAGVWSGAAPPRAITGLLQGGYWTSLTPQALFSYSYFVTALWAAAVAVVAFVVATVWASQFSSARGLSRRRRGVGLGAGASPSDAVNLRATAPVSDQRPSVVTAALWMVGRLAALYSGVYYVLAVTTVFQLWHVAFVHGREAVVAWVLGIAVLLLPVAALLYLSCRRNVEQCDAAGAGSAAGVLPVGLRVVWCRHPGGPSAVRGHRRDGVASAGAAAGAGGGAVAAVAGAHCRVQTVPPLGRAAAVRRAGAVPAHHPVLVGHVHPVCGV